MKIETKYIVAGAIGLVTISGAIAYLQYKRMMNYAFKLKGVKVKKLSATQVSFDVFVDFINKAKLVIKILEVDTKIYLNGKFISTVANKSPMTISAESTSTLSVNISFIPNDVLKAIGSDYLSIITHPESVTIKADIKLKAKLWFFTVNIPYIYNTTLKELTSAK